MNNDNKKKSDILFKSALKYSIQQNYQKAIELLEEAIELGNSDAMDVLASMYENGIGVVQNNEQAIELYKKAIELNNTTAMRNLAKMSDPDSAKELYTKAISSEDAIAMYDLGCFYDTYGNDDMAIPLFKQALVLFENKYKNRHYSVVNNLIDTYKRLEMWFPIAKLCLNHSSLMPIHHKKQIFIQCINTIIMSSGYNFEDFINIINHEKFDETYGNNPPQIIIVLRNLYKEKIDIMDLHFNYAPDAQGYKQAKNDFNERISNI